MKITKAFNGGLEKNPFGVPEDAWRAALESIPAGGVRVAEVKDEGTHAVFVASIPAGKEAGAHFHDSEEETYLFLSGDAGAMSGGKVYKDASAEHGFSAYWEYFMPVGKGDFLVVEEGDAHQLKNPGREELVFLFRCPRNHLTSENRTVLSRAPDISPHA